MEVCFNSMPLFLSHLFWTRPSVEPAPIELLGELSASGSIRVKPFEVYFDC